MKIRYDMVTVLVVRPDEAGTSHEFLQLLRASTETAMGGTWQFVRGGGKASETYVAAARRELREETGIVAWEFYRLDVVESLYTAADDTLWHAPVFCAVVPRNQPIVLNDEHTDYRWIPRAEIESRVMWFNEIELVRCVGRSILDDGPSKAYLRIDRESS